MEAFLSWLLAILAGVIAIPVALFCLEIVAGALRSQVPARPHSAGNRRIAALVPAHNESTAIVPTLEDINAQLTAGDRLLVVADNCTDDTAAIARTLGAIVVERHDTERIGKGYALDFGLQYLSRDPPEIVVMVDADCRLAEDAIDRLASACSMTSRPVQALYLMTVPPGSQINHQVAEFAWRVKNWVRPLGLATLNLPCQLMGSGMAFPWHVIRAADLASGWIVEDLKLGLDLAAAGHPPLFCPSARVSSQFAASARGADTQRRRWEQGHIVTILKIAPRLLYVAISRSNLGLVALTLDLIVPPLSLLAVLLILMFVITGVAAALGLASTALVISAVSLVGFAIAVVLAWSKYGREVLPPRAVLSIPYYILRKLGLYRQILFGRMTALWIRTDRTKS
jgi:cellulose synthase/poly-beta-1,6-N-acetylglucosamine synthase-like glycosyltransferase